jgi:hypothetical protein
LAILVLVCAIGIYYLATIRAGHGWADDFSLYLLHAKNMVEGKTYADSGYIYNPAYPSLSPIVYPPILPLILAPVYALWGLNLAAMKATISIIFLLFLLLLPLFFREYLPFSYLLALVAIIGFSPYFWDFKDEIRADIPFLFFSYLTLFFINAAQQSEMPKQEQLWRGLLVGSLAYLAYGTRTLGVVLVLCLLVWELIRLRRVRPFAVVAFFQFGVLAILQAWLIPSSGYFDQFELNLEYMFLNTLSYLFALAALWDNGYLVPLQTVLFIVAISLAIIGYWERVKTRMSIFELFALLYVGLLIVWPVYQGLRFLIPFIPLYIVYVLVGINQIGLVQPRVEKVVVRVMLATIMLSYAAHYTTVNYGILPDGVATEDAVGLFNYVQTNTEDDAVFIFRRPRALALFTNRSAAVYHEFEDDADLWQFAREIEATYLIAGSLDDDFWLAFIERNRSYLELVYVNNDFRVYKIKATT